MMTKKSVIGIRRRDFRAPIEDEPPSEAPPMTLSERTFVKSHGGQLLHGRDVTATKTRTAFRPLIAAPSPLPIEQQFNSLL
jgi:hypothetical protein